MILVVRGGGPPLGPEAHLVGPEGDWQHLPDAIGAQCLQPVESIVSLSAGGGGYGDPLDRDPERVLEDVVDEWISPERARAAYGVVLAGDPDRWETLRVDTRATAEERLSRRPDSGDGQRKAQQPLRWWAGAELRGMSVK